jgi:hypothetical protein
MLLPNWGMRILFRRWLEAEAEAKAEAEAEAEASLREGGGGELA